MCQFILTGLKDLLAIFVHIILGLFLQCSALYLQCSALYVQCIAAMSFF